MKSEMNVSKCGSVGPFFGLVSINYLNKREMYEIYCSLIHRYNEASERLRSDGKCYKNGTYCRVDDEAIVEVCGNIADKLEKYWHY